MACSYSLLLCSAVVWASTPFILQVVQENEQSNHVPIEAYPLAEHEAVGFHELPEQLSVTTGEETPGYILLNPYRTSPLTALLFVRSEGTAIEVCVQGFDGPESDLHYTLSTAIGASVAVPLIGMYPNRDNTVVLTQHCDNLTQSCTDAAKKQWRIRTQVDPGLLPKITVDAKQGGTYYASMIELAPGAPAEHLSQGMRTVPMIFDRFGKVRWMLVIDRAHYTEPNDFLSTGYLVFGSQGADGDPQHLYQYDLLGQQVHRWPVPTGTLAPHHHVQETRQGTLLVPLSKPKQPFSLVAEFASDGTVVRTVDIAKVLLQGLDMGEQDKLTARQADWLHINSVIDDPHDQTWIVSVRNQFIAKIDPVTKQLRWVFGDESLPWYQTALQHQALTWSAEAWPPQGQHHVSLIAGGDLLVFNNGTQWQSNEVIDPENSRKRSAVSRYRIDEGQQRVTEVMRLPLPAPYVFSSVVSNVQYLPSGHWLVAQGESLPVPKHAWQLFYRWIKEQIVPVTAADMPSRILEWDAQGQLIFTALIDQYSGKRPLQTLYRGARVDLIDLLQRTGYKIS